MKTKLAALSALVLLCAASAKAATFTFVHTNLWEGFSSIDYAWGSGAQQARQCGVYSAEEGDLLGPGGSQVTDTNDWRGAWLFPTRSSIRLGNGTYKGYALSPLIELRPDETSPGDETVFVRFNAANYNSSAGQVKVVVLDGVGTEVTNWISGTVRKLSDTSLTSMDDDDYATDSTGASFSAAFVNLPSSFRLKFQAVSDGRVSIDSILVTQEWEVTTPQIQLANPTGIAFQPSVTAVQAGWTPVENAVGYEWEIRDSSGGLVHSGSRLQDTTYPTMWTTVYGLREDNAYVFRLRATGDGADILDSGWSEEPFRTQQDPWAVLWTVGEFSSQPRVGSEFSFAVSTIRRNGMAVTSVLDRVSPAVSSTPSYAIENGVCVFTWTPGPDEDGDYVAHFAVRDPYGNTTDTKEVPITVRPATEETVLFLETFSKCTGNWGASSPGAFSSSNSDSNYLWSVTSAKRGYSGMRLGNKSTYDAAVTPTIRPVNDAACTVSLSFVAAGWDAGDKMTVTVPEASWMREIVLTNGVDTAASTPLPTGDGYSFGPYEISVSGSFTVSFQRATGDGRMGIDSVKVTQKISTSLIDLDVPTGLAVVDGTLSTNSFSVAWNAVANASSYGVEVYEAGGIDPVRSLAPTATSAAFAGLSDDTDYEVRVRAQGDTSLYNYSDWTNLVVRTERSALNPTLSVGTSWENAIGDGKLYGVIPNTNTVSATLDDGITPVAVALVNVAPAPSSTPGLADGTLAWTPATEDEGTTFTLFFEMTPAPGVVYTNTASFKVNALPALQAPTVTMDADSVTNAGGFASGRAELSWNSQFRATDYAVRAWTGCPNPAATATRVEESFDDFVHGTRPAGWIFKVVGGYDNAADPVKFDDGNWMATYDLGGEISSVSFTAYGHSMAAESTLRVYWAGSLTDEEVADKDNWTNHLVAAASGLVSHSQTVTAQIPAGSGARRLVWQFEKHGGNVGVGSVVIEGTGFATPKFLPGWGPAPVSQGLVQSCTITPTRPGRTNWAEVSVTDGTATYASVVEIDVPEANPATLLILK